MSFSWAARKTGAIRAVADTRNCESEKFAPKFNGRFCESLFYLRPSILPLFDPTEILGPEEVVFLGDTHPNILIKKWLARNLALLKAAGFTHVALEALNSESQPVLDKYLRKTIPRSEIVNLLAKDWGWIPEEHVRLIDAIHVAGLKIIAIDNRNELDRQGIGNDMQLRNNHMAEQIENALTEAQAGRVVVLTGKMHSALSSSEVGILTIPEILRQDGIANLSYDLESVEEYAPKNLIQAFIEELDANRLSPSPSGDYFLPTPMQDSGVHGVIFISR